MLEGDGAEILLNKDVSVSLLRTGNVGGDISLLATLTGLGFLVVLLLLKAK